MSSISGFRIDEGVTFAFNTGGAVPPPSGGATPVNAIAVGHIAAAPIMGNFSVVEEE
ncbi:MAG: hypothetical protein K6A79_03530 [Ruminococcus sp.]|nr:hypothetical protein [Ruminococcus sp.]